MYPGHCPYKPGAGVGEGGRQEPRSQHCFPFCFPFLLPALPLSVHSQEGSLQARAPPAAAQNPEASQPLGPQGDPVRSGESTPTSWKGLVGSHKPTEESDGGRKSQLWQRKGSSDAGLLSYMLTVFSAGLCLQGGLAQGCGF